MPHSCSAWNCTNRFSSQTRSIGITFHRFPKDSHLRKRWETALRRKGFSASLSSMLCSEHFRPEDFDRTGQTVRIRTGAVPSVFRFPAHLHKVGASRMPRFSATPSWKHILQTHAHILTIFTSLLEALARVESLERERRNAKDREKRAKKTVSGLLEDLRMKKLINEDLKEQIDLYSGINK
uniref:Si:ch73-130a3.4 n=1 Tax=Poecilia latipinna TaxID=48699 RepID=A0A3B3V942_9TELE